MLIKARIKSFHISTMFKYSPVAIFMAASALLSVANVNSDLVKADDNTNREGGLKEWTTDDALDADSKLDEDAKKAAKKAKESNFCVPIGEGENCW